MVRTARTLRGYGYIFWISSSSPQKDEVHLSIKTHLQPLSPILCLWNCSRLNIFLHDKWEI